MDGLHRDKEYTTTVNQISLLRIQCVLYSLAEVLFQCLCQLIAHRAFFSFSGASHSNSIGSTVLLHACNRGRITVHGHGHCSLDMDMGHGTTKCTM